MASIYRVLYTSKAVGDRAALVSATTPANAWAAVQTAFPATNKAKQATMLVSVTEVHQTGNILVGS